MECAPLVRLYNIPALVQIKALRRHGNKPLSETMKVSFLGAFIRGCLSFVMPFRISSCFTSACTWQRGKIAK